MKKLLSFVLSIAIILTMAINCFAVEAETFDNISESMNRNAMTGLCFDFTEPDGSLRK